MAQVQRGGALRPCFIMLLWAPGQPLSPGCGTAVVALPQHARTAQLRVLGWDGTCPCHPRRDGAQAGFAPGGGTGWMRSLPRSWLRFGGSGAKEGGGGDGGKCGSSWRPTQVWLPSPNPPFRGSAGSVLGVQAAPRHGLPARRSSSAGGASWLPAQTNIRDPLCGFPC